MVDEIKLLGISGSLRRDSHNTGLLRTAQRHPPEGATLEIFDGLADVPPYNEDDDVEPVHPGVARLRGAIAAADGLLIASPEYNGTVPGVLKNAIDWASRPFPDGALKKKPVAVIGASTSLFGGTWAQADVRKAFEIAGAYVLEDELPIGESHKIDRADGVITSDEVIEALNGVLENLCGHVRTAIAA